MKLEYHLYRAKFIKPRQTDFLHEDLTPVMLFMASIAEKPSAQFKKDFVWHIGNVTEIYPRKGYFAIGRTAVSTIPKFDYSSGDFKDFQDDTSPYTYVVFDADIGLMAIMKKSDLCPDTEDVAVKIEKLLSQTNPIIKNGITVKIDLIPNPNTFLELIANAFAVKSFTATFTGPNPFDADKYFQKPLSVYLSAAAGDIGEATIEGQNLNKEVVSEVAKSTSTTGNTASARIQPARNKRVTRIKMSQNPIKLSYDDNEGRDPKVVLTDVIALYNETRGTRELPDENS